MRAQRQLAHPARVGEPRVDHLGADSRQALDDGKPAVGQIRARISALVAQHQPPVAQRPGGREHPLGDQPEAFAGQVHPAERVVHARVKSTSDEHERRVESLQCRDHHPVERDQVGSPARARGQRHVDGRAGAVAVAGVLEQPAARREQVLLVQRDRQHRRIGPEAVLGAVAVVDIPVDDRHPVESAYAPQVRGGQRRIGEHAVAAAAGRPGVVARRAYQCVRVVDGAVDDRVDGLDAAASGQRRDLVGAASERRGSARVAAGPGAGGADRLDVLAVVKPQQLRFGRRSRRDRHQLPQQAAGVEEVAHPPLDHTALEAGLGFEHRLGPDGVHHPARVVPRVALVPHPAGCARHVPPRSWPRNLCHDRPRSMP